MSATTIDNIRQRLPAFWQLMRFDRPIGTLLLLWPTLWALWLAAGSQGKVMPDWDVLVIFTLGVILMRAAGCVINDFADRKVDGHVERTQGRPLVQGTVTSKEAVALFMGLCLVAFVLVLMTNTLTVQLAFGGVALAFCYPFMKRYTHLPQVVLGAAFAWSIPMAFAAQTNELSPHIWLVYVAVVLWTVAYDTFYAMVDRNDDLKIGVKSTAILFGEQDRLITGVLQGMVIVAMLMVGQRFELGQGYYASLILAASLFVYQQYLIRYRQRQACFSAFLNNNWVGAIVFMGIALDALIR
ncbi:4-hydroxybenzoate octaprenyltransferase [Maricurvus nonylphenolicus]|uniref:4-hydroxybenzoate octaprenyltransferase n=1 Tax=Maricurvus nonylphenolicus TaxID=1008307 RepID=UPI0036F32FF6